MSAPLPPGWSQEWDEGGTPYYISPDGVSQWDPPSDVGSSDPSQPTDASAAPPVSTTAASNSKRRQYAAAQAAYVNSTFDPSIPDPNTNNQNVPQGGGELFTPGYGQQQPPAQQPYYAGGGQDQAAAGGYAGGQGGYGQQQGGANALAGQFGQMGMGEKGSYHDLKYPLNITNLVGMQPDVERIEEAPPAIRLPPGSTLTDSPDAIPDPSYMRSTLNAVPMTNSLLNKSKLPFGLVLTPYRTLKEGDPEVPVVKDTVIARCRRCRSYINPYVTFIEGGNRWKCPMCNLANDVPQLFDWNQETNQPADRWQRPELNCSVVEFVAPTEYMVRPPQPPCYIFVIDVSEPAVKSGMVATAARTILESLDRLPNDDGRTKVALIAVDTSLHFFCLPPGEAAEPTMLVVSDLEDVFLPRTSDLLVNIVEARKPLESMLAGLNDMFQDAYAPNSALGPALQAAFQLASKMGGKIVCLASSLPSHGPGALKNRDDPKALGTNKESALLQAASPFYKTFAIDCSRAQVSVDMFLFGSGYTDVSTLSCLPRYTGGQTYMYPAFNASRAEDAIKFAHEFGEVLASRIALEAVIRVRASRGLRMKAFHGNFFIRSTDLLSLPAVPVDQSYSIEVELEDNLTQKVVVMQTAVLHTTCYGERRIRVVSLALPTTDNLTNIFASADGAAITTLLACKAVERTMQSKLEDARTDLMKQLTDMLSAFKGATQAGGGGAATQLAVPENLRFLPLMILGLLKHVGIRESSSISPDMRSYAQGLLTTFPTQLLIPYLHPRFYALHTMPDDAGTIDEKGLILPPVMNLTSERLERHGLFMIEDGQNIFLWIGRDAVPQLVQDVFDLPSYAELPSGKTTLPPLDNSFSQRVNAIIGKTREMRRSPYRPHVFVVKDDGEPALRAWALSELVEDKFDRSPSYSQFISTLREKVNASN